MTETTEGVLTVEEQRQRAVEWLEYLNRLDAPTLEPYLPLIFQLRGKPYTLHDHFPFASLFRTRLPRRRILRTGRQVSKTTYMATASLMLAAKHGHLIQLFITPLFEQIRRFSVNYIQPFIDESLIKHLIVDTSCNQSVLQRTFLNKSMMQFSYAYLSSARIRGIGGVAKVFIDEFQDMDSNHVPIINECMSAAPVPWGLTDMTGTPKGFDNPIQSAWEESSQATWVILCPHAGCGKENFCTTEFDLLKMIGPLHDDIGPAEKGGVPATVCAKCQKPVDPRTGFWLHRNPERRWTYQGFHIPQPIMPMHHRNPVRWAELLAKMQGRNNVAPNVFHNEVLGESYDVGSKLLTKSELTAACTLPWDNDPKQIPTSLSASLRHQYEHVVLGIDWGGGGGEMMSGFSEKARRKRISFTTVALLGIRMDRKIDVLWGRRLLTPNDHAREAAEVLRIIKEVRPTFIAHDFTGSGALRQTLLVQAGVPEKMFIGFDYKSVTRDTIMKFIPADNWDIRAHYRVDKTRTLLTTINAIKFGLLRFFRYDNHGEADPGLLDDFLSLTEEKVEMDNGSDRYYIRRMLSSPDDFAHAVNVGCCTLWYMTQSWPDFVHMVNVGPSDLADGVGWDGVLDSMRQ